MTKKALLIIPDGWGIGNRGKGNMVNNTPTPYLDYLSATCSYSQLQASGENVGLPDRQMGNSEVGHLNIGAGHVAYRDLVKISKAYKNGPVLQNPEIIPAYTYVQKTGEKLRLMGLISNDGVHSPLDHLYQLLTISKKYSFKNTYVRCFVGGHGTDPKSGVSSIEALQHVYETNDVYIASIVRRSYIMDRDKRWSRVKKVYDLLVSGVGKKATGMVRAMHESYAEDVTDEFTKPIANVAVQGQIEEGDVVILSNFRNDRTKEPIQVLIQTDMPDEGMHAIRDLQYYTMTPYDANSKNVRVLFLKENIEVTLGEYLGSLDKKQLHTAKTEKCAHVISFFNGGREEPYKGEDRILVNSPKVATHDLKSEMSAYEVKDKLVDAIGTQQYDFIVVNFADGNMAGHAGVYNATAKAVWAIDHCVKEVVETAKADDYKAIITADHGNVGNAINEDGTSSTAHSLNLIPFVHVTSNSSATMRDGRSVDVAPSMLHVMGLEQPEAMTGEDLIVD